MTLSEVPAREARTFTVSKAKGMRLSEFVLRYGSTCQSAVRGRQRTFGGTEAGRIDDLPNGTMAASFLSRLSAAQDSTHHFITPPGLDLSSVTEHGNAVL